MTQSTISLKSGAALLLLSLVAACNRHHNGPISPAAPTVLSNAPVNLASAVRVDTGVNVIFSEVMNSATVNDITFTLRTHPTAPAIAGSIVNTGASTVFVPTVNLADNTTYYAKVTTGAQNVAGTGLVAEHSWSFSTSVAPSVTLISPDDLATNVPINTGVSITFSEEMDVATLGLTTFTLELDATGPPLGGTIVYANAKAVFWPAVALLTTRSYTAKCTTAAKSVGGIAIREDRTWSFATSASSTPPGIPVDLGRAGTFAVLAKAGISTVPASTITGHIGVSPAAATAITQFSLVPDSTNTFSTSTQVTGRVYAADYAPPTPDNMTNTVLDMQAAFTDAASRAPDTTELHGGAFGGQTINPGVHKISTGVSIATDMTVTGTATDVWIFQIAGDLIMSNGRTVLLGGQAKSKNIFWQVSGLVDLGTTTTFHGNILCATGISLQTGATVTGRLLAQTAVTLGMATVTEPPQ